MTLPFLPEALQTERQGELSVRVQIKPSEITALRVIARKAGIVYRTVVVSVTDARKRDQYWVFSKAPIPQPKWRTQQPSPEETQRHSGSVRIRNITSG